MDTPLVLLMAEIACIIRSKALQMICEKFCRSVGHSQRRRKAVGGQGPDPYRNGCQIDPIIKLYFLRSEGEWKSRKLVMSVPEIRTFVTMSKVVLCFAGTVHRLSGVPILC